MDETNLEQLIDAEEQALHGLILTLCRAIINFNQSLGLAYPPTSINDVPPQGYGIEGVKDMGQRFRQRQQNERELFELLRANDIPSPFFVTVEGIRYVGDAMLNKVVFKPFEETPCFGPSIPGHGE